MIIFLEKLQVIVSSWNKLAIKPSPLSSPSSSYRTQGKNEPARPLKKQGGDRIFSPALLLVSDSWFIEVEFWLEQSLFGGRAILSLHPDPGTENPTAAGRIAGGRGASKLGSRGRR